LNNATAKTAGWIVKSSAVLTVNAASLTTFDEWAVADRQKVSMDKKLILQTFYPSVFSHK